MFSVRRVVGRVFIVAVAGCVYRKRYKDICRGDFMCLGFFFKLFSIRGGIEIVTGVVEGGRCTGRDVGG